MKKELIALVRELQSKRIVCVPLALVCAFVVECHELDVECNGGALSNDFSTQYFYN